MRGGNLLSRRVTENRPELERVQDRRGRVGTMEAVTHAPQAVAWAWFTHTAIAGATGGSPLAGSRVRRAGSGCAVRRRSGGGLAVPVLREGCFTGGFEIGRGH